MANKEKGILSKRLATILLDAPISVDEEALTIKPFNAEKVQSLFEELEFRTLAKRLLSTPIQSQSNEEAPTKTASSPADSNGQMDLFSVSEDELQESSFQNIDDVETNYVLVDNAGKRKALLEELLNQKSVCFDTETTGLDPRTAELIGFYPFVLKRIPLITLGYVKEKKRPFWMSSSHSLTASTLKKLPKI